MRVRITGKSEFVDDDSHTLCIDGHTDAGSEFVLEVGSKDYYDLDVGVWYDVTFNRCVNEVPRPTPSVFPPPFTYQGWAPRENRGGTPVG